MIFPEISLNDWLKVYPDLKVKKVSCSCGNTLESTIPFISKSYIGLTTPSKCSCGNDKIGANSMITKTSKEQEDWLQVFSYL